MEKFYCPKCIRNWYSANTIEPLECQDCGTVLMMEGRVEDESADIITGVGNGLDTCGG